MDECLEFPTAQIWSVGVGGLAHKQVAIKLSTLLVLVNHSIKNQDIDRYLHLMDARHRLNKDCERKVGTDRILLACS